VGYGYGANPTKEFPKCPSAFVRSQSRKSATPNGVSGSAFCFSSVEVSDVGPTSADWN
jgi:hypothetical protein